MRIGKAIDDVVLAVVASVRPTIVSFSLCFTAIYCTRLHAILRISACCDDRIISGIRKLIHN